MTVLAMMVLIVDYEHAKQMVEIVTGSKVYADVRADDAVPAVTMEQLTELGFVECKTIFSPLFIKNVKKSIPQININKC